MYQGRSPQLGSYIKLDNIAHLFNGTRTVFTLTSGGKVYYTTNPYTLLITLNGAVQEPLVDFTIEQGEITFTTAPASSTDCYILSLGNTFHSGGLKSISLFTRDNTRYTIPITATTVPVITRTETVGVLINPA